MKTELIFQDQDYISNIRRSRNLRHRRLIMSLFLIFSDALAISGSFLISIAFWGQVRADLQVKAHLSLIIPALIFFIFIFQLMALYPAIGVGPVEELKKLSICIFFVMLGIITISFFFRNTATFSRVTLVLSWIIIAVSVPLSRKVFRRIALKLGLWGIPTMIVGEKKSVLHIYKQLRAHPLTGFWPVVCLSGEIKDIFPRDIRENSIVQLFPQIRTLIIAQDQRKFDNLRHLVTQKKYRFKNIIILFDDSKVGPIWFTPIRLVEYMGFEVVHNLLKPSQKFGKRILEIALIILSTPVLVPLFAVIVTLIKTLNPGPVFYKQQRIGLDGKEIWIWKFRTMVFHAEKILKSRLQADDQLKLEWEENFKLKDDPRITSIGRFLRRTSLDELPQIWNVVQGEMSLLGPRPIVEEEISLYGEDFEIYKQVLPGITGLWQIAGRNDLPYQSRIMLDVYYIQNWSIWLDIHILLHTALAVLLARGAY